MIAESLRLERDGPGCVELRSIGRYDVSSGTRTDSGVRSEDGAVAGQPSVWTFVDFVGPDTVAAALAAVILGDGGWYADIDVRDDEIVVFADQAVQARGFLA